MDFSLCLLLGHCFPGSPQLHDIISLLSDLDTPGRERGSAHAFPFLRTHCLLIIVGKPFFFFFFYIFHLVF